VTVTVVTGMIATIAIAAIEDTIEMTGIVTTMIGTDVIAGTGMMTTGTGIATAMTTIGTGTTGGNAVPKETGTTR
jgi:hypothetical protein